MSLDETTSSRRSYPEPSNTTSSLVLKLVLLCSSHLQFHANLRKVDFSANLSYLIPPSSSPSFIVEFRFSKMSQGSTTFPATPVCLSLSKFSYATVSNDSIVPIPWIHLSSKTGLFAIFESNATHLEDGQITNRKRLKIIRDPEVMVRFLLQSFGCLPCHSSGRT